MIQCRLLFIPFPVLMIFFRQLLSMCEFQRLQIVNVLNVLSFLPQGHTGAAETVFRAQWVLHSGTVTKLFSEEDVGLLTLICNFKKQKTNKQKNCQLLLDLGMILKWGNLLMNLSIDSVRNRHLERWPLLSEIGRPKPAASSKNIGAGEFF